MTFIMKNNSAKEKILAVATALVLWQFASFALAQDLLLVSPVKVFYKICTLIIQINFWQSVWFSLSRIMLGFFAALIVGIILAIICQRFHIIEMLIWPYIAVIKSTPVASFIILCLIWLNSSNLPIFISFLMVLPIVYTNMLNGLKSTDVKMVQMCDVFKLSWIKRLMYIYIPQVKTYLISACSISLGLAWKAGIAAEVIGIPNGSIGERLYEAKIYLNTAELFAWTVVIVLVSVLFEKTFMFLIKKAYSLLEAV